MITLSETQLAVLNAITYEGGPHYWEGYNYLLSIIESDSAYDDFEYWLGKAAEINANSFSSEANAFIRGVTRAGLLYDFNWSRGRRHSGRWRRQRHCLWRRQ
ncbi:hypothetical protein AMC87_PD00127 (plasmid) [Rhizobium phaseoli]|nr:hypothetical protein AMC88_PD00728 [Rhizobium phaseoli]ANL50254.1 hypothetical protein AMC87_PD00127 [Rhizobium phaseoli]ANL63534.1 hypothetical protein AMC85_PD00729 [Rhizobium phaseoli]